MNSRMHIKTNQYLQIFLKLIMTTNAARGFLIFITLFTRFSILDSRPLWIDETWRANLILQEDVLNNYIHSADIYTAITSPGFVLVTKIITLPISISPINLKIVSILSALIFILLVYEIVRFYDKTVAFMASFTISLATPTMNASIEFKQYMMESTVHAAVIYVIIKKIRMKNSSNFVLPAAGILALLFTPTIVFLLPILLIIDLKQTKNSKISVFNWIFVVGTSLALYQLIWRYAASEEMQNIWQVGFEVGSLTQQLGFQALSLISTFGGFIGTSFPFLSINLLLYFLLCLVYIFMKNQFQLRNLIAIIGMTSLAYFTVVCANLIGKWPVGNLRVNLFLQTNLMIILFLVLAQITNIQLKQKISMFVLGLFLVTNNLFLGLSPEKYGPPVERSDLALSSVVENSNIMAQLKKDCAKGKKVNIYISNGIGDAIEFYNKHNNQTLNKYKPLIESCVTFQIFGDPMDLGKKWYLEKDSKNTTNLVVIYTHYSELEQALLNEMFPNAVHNKYVGAGSILPVDS